jgi:chloramphenicol O-acetyltransferase type A
MNYTEIDIDSWDRRELFKLYTTDLKIVMNMTVDVDITEFLAEIKAKGYRFYPSMIWLVARLMNARDEFKYHLRDDGTLIRWDYVSPSYTDFNPETEKFNKFVTEYSPDFKTFYERAIADMARHKNEVGFLPDQPKNVFDISCVPWTSYKSLDLHIYGDGKSLFPIILWGKYREENGRILLPVTAMLHHAVCDGFTVSRFFNELQAALKSFKINH